MNPARDTELRRLNRLFLGAGSGELLKDIATGARRIMPMLENIRPEDRGSSADAESLAAHLDALSQQTMKLAKRIRLEHAEATHDD
jgi:hypothetical protein